MPKEKLHHIKPKILENVRTLRRPLTKTEARLWNKLRDQQLANLKFRKQHPKGNYILDFYCPSAKLVIEIDGDSHNQQLAYDAKRTNWLELQGYKVIRFTNWDIINNLEGVLHTILNETLQESDTNRINLDTPPSPQSPPH